MILVLPKTWIETTCAMYSDCYYSIMTGYLQYQNVICGIITNTDTVAPLSVCLPTLAA